MASRLQRMREGVLHQREFGGLWRGGRVKTSLERTRGRTQIGGGKGNSAICEVTPHQDAYSHWNTCGWWEVGFCGYFPRAGNSRRGARAYRGRGCTWSYLTERSPGQDLQNPVEGQQALCCHGNCIQISEGNGSPSTTSLSTVSSILSVGSCWDGIAERRQAWRLAVRTEMKTHLSIQDITINWDKGLERLLGV